MLYRAGRRPARVPRRPGRALAAAEPIGRPPKAAPTVDEPRGPAVTADIDGPCGLGPQQGGRIVADRIVPAALGGAVAQERPVVVFVAGQAGAGKTVVVDLVHAALAGRGGAVRVDRDLYKTLHPHYRRLLAEDVRTAGVRVREDTYQWAAQVEDLVRKGRYDAVVEAPLGRPEQFLAEIDAYRRSGYRVEIVALAVPEALSALGVLDRYLRLAEQGRPRFVSWDNHDACAAAPARHPGRGGGRGLADRITIVRRSTQTALEAVYDNEAGPDGRWMRPAGAAKAVLAERRRPWDAAQTSRFRRDLAAAERRVGDPRLPEDWALAVRRDAEHAAALAEPLRRTAQPLRQPPGVDYHRLNADEHAFVFDELIVPMMLSAVTPQEQPLVVYVAGQPGAGKTRAAHLVRRALPGAVHLSGDDFKVMHPDYWTCCTPTHATPRARSGPTTGPGRPRPKRTCASATGTWSWRPHPPTRPPSPRGAEVPAGGLPGGTAGSGCARRGLPAGDRPPLRPGQRAWRARSVYQRQWP
ncbi:AAA family ATPase [Streptacidiphilus sp. 4-A2]|nr:AAA family ATPase [Streptacidiphilus sp. 4-A2]